MGHTGTGPANSSNDAHRGESSPRESHCYVPSGKHAECNRKFFHLSRAWYGKANLEHRRNCVDEILIGMYHPERGATGEFTIQWTELAGSLAPLLCVYDDAWDALWQFRDVLEALTEIDGQNAPPDKICELLVSCGVEDATPVESPYGEPAKDRLYEKPTSAAYGT